VTEQPAAVPEPELRNGGATAPLVPFAEAYRGRTAFASATRPPLVRRYLPFVGSMRRYSRDDIGVDALAGLTVAALALPSAMAYAELAGLPVTAGLYALLLPVLAYAIFGTGVRVVVGPEGAIALLVGSALAPLAAAGSPEYAALAAGLALAVALVFLAARLLRLGWLADYFSQSVLVGYITGVAVLIILDQFEKLTGIASEEENSIRAAVDVLSHLADANVATVLVAAASFGLLLLFGRLLPKWPGALVVVVLSILASWLLDLASQGVKVTGSIPAGLPSVAVPDLAGSQVASLIGPAVAIFLVAFADAILTARSFAARRGETIDADQELLAFSVAQAGAGLTQGMPIGTSGSRTAVNDSMRARSQVSGMVGFAAIALILLFLTAPIQYLPSAVLGAIIVFAALKLIEGDQWRDLARSSRAEVGIAAITAVVVLIIGVLPAIAVAVALSIIDVVRRSATPDDAVLGYSQADGRYADVRGNPAAGVTPGTVVYRIQGRLFFANAHFFKRRVWAAVDGAPRPVHHLVLDAAMVSGVDAAAVGALRELHDGLTGRSISFEVARATVELRAQFDETGLTGLIGAEHFHPTVTAAVEAVAGRGSTEEPRR
jgi:high affinity sulfate transporter 1